MSSDTVMQDASITCVIRVRREESLLSKIIGISFLDKHHKLKVQPYVVSIHREKPQKLLMMVCVPFVYKTFQKMFVRRWDEDTYISHLVHKFLPSVMSWMFWLKGLPENISNFDDWSRRKHLEFEKLIGRKILLC